MNAQNPGTPVAVDEFVLSDADYRAIAAIAKTRFGLDLQPSKKPLIHSRLSKRLRALKLKNFTEYCNLVSSNADAAEENHLLTALTTNVTHFFREPHHFAYIKDVLGPDLIARSKAGQPIRFWSAACSTGEEAYCLAATLYDLLPNADQRDIRILATDIDPQVVGKAEAGRYPLDQLDQIPPPLRKNLVVTDGQPGTFGIASPIRRMIRFGRLNLISDWPMRRPFDLVMCRNVAIYFDKETQARLWQRFADCLRPGGHLMIGHSERLNGSASTVFQNVGITTYRKPASAEPRLETA